MKMHHLALGLALVGCDTTLPGEDGNLTLSYTHGGLFESVSNPIGSGLRADVIIRDAATGDPAEVTDASAADSTILTVSGLSGGTMDLVGVGAGDTSLNVEADALVDTFAIAVRDVATVTYADPTGAGEGYAIATGASIWIPRTARDDAGEELTGYGLDLPTATTPGTLEGVEDGAIGSTLVRFDAAGEAGLSYGGENDEKVFTVVSSETVSWEVSDAVIDEPLVVGAVRAISVTGTLEDGAVYGSIATNDDAVCSTKALLGSPEVYTLIAAGAGDCKVFLNGGTEPVLEYAVSAE